MRRSWVRAHRTERFRQGLAQYTHVCPRPQRTANLSVRPSSASRLISSIRTRPSLDLDLSAFTSVLIEWLSSDLHCRVHRWSLHPVTEERLHRIADHAGVNRRNIMRGDHLTITIRRVCLLSQQQVSLVALGSFIQERNQACGVTTAIGSTPGERSRVPV